MSLQELKANSVTGVPAVALDLVTNEFLTFRLGSEDMGLRF
jgi:purine-binding chemotaxis protein CheW